MMHCLRVAQTKGAISNKEMELFLAPAPSTLDDESVWIQWIGDRQRALNCNQTASCISSNRTEPGLG